MASVSLIDPRVLGLRIADARKARGKTQEEVAEFLECSRPTYIAIEKGERPAKPDEIIKLAGFFGRTIHDLVRPDEPLADLGEQLRSFASKLKDVDRPSVIQAIDDFQRLAEDYRELERILNAPLPYNYPPQMAINARLNPVEFADGEAQRDRQRLGLGDQPVINVRAMLEWEVGLRIFYLDMHVAVSGMYAYHADLGACIVVNRKHPPERRRLSMLHAYAHLLVDRYKPQIDTLTIPGRKPPSEVFAETFAASFLMPASSVRQRFHDIVTSTNDFQVADLRRLAHFYFVSVESMAERLRQLGLIAKASWQSSDGTMFERNLPEVAGLRPQPINDQLYPERYQFLAVSAYERDEIGDSDLASFLRCDIVSAREIALSTLTSRELVTATGEERDVRLNFSKSLLVEAS